MSAEFACMRRQRAAAVALDLLLAAVTNAPATGRVSRRLPFGDSSVGLAVRRGANNSGPGGEAVRELAPDSFL